MIFHLRCVILLIYILASNLIFAQENSAKYTYSADAEIFTGFIIKHHDVIGHLIKGHPSGVRLKFNKESYGHKTWEQQYNYPTFTTTLSYYDLKNDEVLGKIVSINFGLNFHLIDFINTKNDLQLLLGYGLAYYSNPYDQDTNNTNTLISTHFPWSVNLRLAYSRRITNRVKIGAGLQFSHFSNGSSSVPNHGLNIINLNLGASYNFYKERQDYLSDRKMLHDYSAKIFMNFDFRMGKTELMPVGSGSYPYYAMSIFWNKQVGRKSILDAGVELFINKAIEATIEIDKPVNEGQPDYKCVGIMIGHELLLGKLAFVTQLGVYVYKPYLPEERIYFKVGLKYYFTKNVYGSFMLKSHDAIAEVMEYGIGFRF